MDKTTLAMDKTSLRRAVKSATLEFIGTTHSASAEAEDLQRVTAAENAIWTAFEHLPAYSQARTVLLYAALPDEVATEEFIRRCSAAKRVVLPVVSGETLILREYDSTLLRSGYRGIPEPSDDAPTVDPSEIDLAAIPGVAFTRNGGRLGRGKGFYDRLLPQLSCQTVGIAYPCQIVDALPLDPWDRLLDIVL